MPEALSAKSDNPAQPLPGEGKISKIGIVTALVIAAVGLSTYLLLRDDGDATGGKGKATTIKSVLHLETFVLNLADTDSKAYLRVGIDLGLAQAPAQGEAAPVALVRDTILTVLAKAKADEVETSEGKEKLKQGLLEALRRRAPGLGVEEVYFTEFLVQR